MADTLTNFPLNKYPGMYNKEYLWGGLGIRSQCTMNVENILLQSVPSLFILIINNYALLTSTVLSHLKETVQVQKVADDKNLLSSGFCQLNIETIFQHFYKLLLKRQFIGTAHTRKYQVSSQINQPFFCACQKNILFFPKTYCQVYVMILFHLSLSCNFTFVLLPELHMTNHFLLTILDVLEF